MGAKAEVVKETPVEEDRGIDEGTAVKIKDEFAFGSALRPFDRLRDLGTQGPRFFVVSEDLHVETCVGMKSLIFREIASEIPRHTHRAAVLTAAMLQLGLHFFGCGISQRLEHQP